MLSSRIRDLRPSPVRAMLAASQRPDVISFAGGLPSAASFADVPLAAPEVQDLQYGPTEGEPELRALVARRLAGLGVPADPEHVLILSGSQQGIDLAAKLFIEPGARIALERPSYLAAIQAFRFFGAAFEPVAPEAPGAGWRAGDAPRMAYVIPTFGNPTGRCWSGAERAALARACVRSGVALFEDDPYRDLAYAPCDRRPVAADMEGGSWIHQGSVSKILAPGLRVGYLAASADLFPHLVALKQAADLHTCRIAQRIAARAFADPDFDARLARLAAGYRDARDRFEAALAANLRGLLEWRTPPGGLFVWARLSGGGDTSRLLEAASRQGVLFAPGEAFDFADDGPSDWLRLNFSCAGPEAADRGLAILARLIREGAALTDRAA